jgi:hypothetical protein
VKITVDMGAEWPAVIVTVDADDDCVLIQLDTDQGQATRMTIAETSQFAAVLNMAIMEAQANEHASVHYARNER